MWGRGDLLEAESERWSAPELYDVWVPGCEARSALSTWDIFFLKRTDLGSSAAAWQWWMASTCDLSVFTAQQSKNMIDHHVMGESREGLQEELSDCWNKMEPSVKVKQNHHSGFSILLHVPWFQDHLWHYQKFCTHWFKFPKLPQSSFTAGCYISVPLSSLQWNTEDV